MAEEREVVRHFPENSMKGFLHRPANVHDLLALGEFALLSQLRLEKMVVDPTTYVTADYRHAISDVVVSVPWHKSAGRRRKPLWLTILIEHQSEPDRLIALRVLEYLVQIWKKQVRDHEKKYGSTASVRLQPILPVVFYTGLYRWERLGQLIDLMIDAADLRDYVPEFKPIFVNLPELSVEKLNGAGAFGQMLRVVQQRKERRKAFEQVLADVVGRLEPLAKAERARWLEMLKFCENLVYHSRSEPERESLRQVIVSSAQNHEDRLELDMGWKTMAEVDREKWHREGVITSRHETLLRLLRLRFGELSPELLRSIQTTHDLQRIDNWIDRVLTAKSLDEIGIDDSH